MKNNDIYLQTKKRIGGEVFDSFNRKINESHFRKGIYVEKIIQAADIAEEMPFVTMPLRDNGILRPGERNTHLLHIYQPNLWSQDFAFSVGELGKMTVNTAIERANATVDHVLKTSKNIREVFKKTGTREYDLFLAMRQAAMIESAYYTRLGRGEIPENARKKIDSALLKRTYKNTPLFKSVIDSVGINGLDGKELLDFSDDIQLAEVLQLFVEKDPYYNRRINQINRFGEMNAEKSASLKQINTESFFEAMITRAVKRFPAMAGRIKRVIDEQEEQENRLII